MKIDERFYSHTYYSTDHAKQHAMSIASNRQTRTGRAELRARAGPSPDLEDTYGCFRRTNETQYSNVARTWEPRETEKNVRAKKKLIPYA